MTSLKSELGSGEIPGLDQALIDVLRAFKPGGVGVCELDPVIQVVLPVSWWMEWAWYETGSVSVPASGGDPVTMYTVPQDERNFLEYLTAERTAGDNTFNMFTVDCVDGYRGGADNDLRLLQLTTAGTIAVWPDRAGRQTLTEWVDTWPLMLEPGTTVMLDPAAAGSSASTFKYKIRLLRQKIVRARAP